MSDATDSADAARAMGEGGPVRRRIKLKPRTDGGFRRVLIRFHHQDMAGVPAVLHSLALRLRIARVHLLRPRPRHRLTVFTHQQTGGATMPTSQRSCYRGFSITTRWSEVRLPVAMGFPARGPPSQFIASFSVDPYDDQSWQQFPTSMFDTSGRAADNALTAAKRAIDSRLSPKGESVG